jgi:hypothetical protein
MAEAEKKEHTLMEGNLLEYPIFSMQKRRVDKTLEEYIWQEKDGVGRVTVERRFKVDCTKGVPNFFDMDVFNAIMRIYVKKSGVYKKNEIHFTVYELMRELSLPVHDGRTVNRVRESLERMAKTNLHFENAFYAEKEKITKIVHLIARIEIYEKQKGNRFINMIKVVLDDELVNSIERKYYKLIDFKIYKALATGIPRRLYEYLEKKKYRKNQFEIEIKKLAKWIGLKTSKPSQLKELIERANDELKEKGIIDKWKYNRKNVIYYFRKSERFKEVEDNLFYLENLTVTFYKSLGQEKVSEVLRREGMVVLQDLIDEGYTREEVAYALGWAVDNIKGIHSIRIIPKVIGQALGDKESRRLVEEREKLEQQKRLEEDRKREEDRRRAEELDKIFERLPKEKQKKLEEKARENLIEQGINPNFILPTLLRLERNKLLEKKKSLVKV